MEKQEVWQSVLAEFELKVSKASFSTWFQNTGIGEINEEEGKVCICVPNSFIKSWLEKKYHNEIKKLLEEKSNLQIREVEYEIEKKNKIQDMKCQPDQTPEVSTPDNPQFAHKEKKDKKEVAEEYGISRKYNFETFVVGKGNELAHAAAKAVAEEPGKAYNPLFIYGDVGLGKTHLLQAIANEILNKNKHQEILYVSAEKFTSEYVGSVKEGAADEFKDRYRDVNLLLIDDIQFISGKEQTQEEFFHTFNSLYQSDKQIVISSDRPPKSIPALEERLQSRFEWGMIADVDSPDLETRVAILEKKCQQKDFEINQELLELIATLVQSNIRELEGALNKIIAYHQLKNFKPTEDSIKSVLDSFKSQNQRKTLTPKEILETVADFFDIELEDILGKSRKKKYSLPRQIAMFLLREELDMSYPGIGNELGGRDHTTAIHGYEKIEKKVEENLDLKEDVELVKQRLYSNIKSTRG
ncbi:MAG: chromosomal replication initiator protein DnaA [Parcubacteria group bacterium QH_9_35_7]|nr:MAG: chromosomal replication initiator protein DnaA [Parcubacteria group bacterium QH_9_35_7]